MSDGPYTHHFDVELDPDQSVRAQLRRLIHDGFLEPFDVDSIPEDAVISWEMDDNCEVTVSVQFVSE